MKQTDDTVPIYSMGVVRKLTGLTPRQIRYYEEMNLVFPARSKGNQRIFSAKDVEMIITIKKLLNEGLTIEGIKTLFAQQHSPQKQSRRKKDDEILPGHLRGGRRLTSLYPIDNQEELMKYLETLFDDD